VRRRRPAPAAKRPGRSEIGPREREPGSVLWLVFTRADLASRAATPRRRTSYPV